MLKGTHTKLTICINQSTGRFPGYITNILNETKIRKKYIIELDKNGNDISTGNYFDFKSIDTVICIGANDIINCSAVEDPESTIYQHSVCKVWEAKKCVIFKNSLSLGYMKVENPTFAKANVFMVLGSLKNNIIDFKNQITKAGLEDKDNLLMIKGVNGMNSMSSDKNDKCNLGDLSARSVDSELELVYLLTYIVIFRIKLNQLKLTK